MRNLKHLATLFGLAGLVLLVTLVAFGLFGGGSPTLAAPAPFPLFIAYVYVGDVAFLIPAILFMAWSWPLARGQARVPVRSLVLIAIVLVLSVAWHLAGGWRSYYGVGMGYIWLACVVLVVGSSMLCRRRPRFWLNSAAHCLLFAWLASYAFPYYGEVP